MIVYRVRWKAGGRYRWKRFTKWQSCSEWCEKAFDEKRDFSMWARDDISVIEQHVVFIKEA